ncbi:MAG TPA: tRNA adenosine(34) deaminase TadA [Holophagaceae bacterium]|nr:tRNA adenosine(34) deaminase TadA [Holophagaceae bacterium]
MWTPDDTYFMRLALEEAEASEKAGEVPIGAILVLEGRIVGRGRNLPITQHDPTAHAEIQALRSAGQWLQNYRLTDATLYVTLEPCLMCFGALTHARVARVIYAASDPKVGISQLQDALAPANLNHRLTLQGGLLADESRALIQAFFQSRRAK